MPAAYVVLESLPLTPNGKVDRKALSEIELTVASSVEYVAPRTPSELALVAIWQELLGLDRVGVHDNFFQLGGDSILSIQAVARSNKAGLRLTARQMFEHQTIAELAMAAIVDVSEPKRAAGVGPSSRTLIETRETTKTEGYTPSDFPLLKLDQRQLDKLLSKINETADPTSIGKS